MEEIIWVEDESRRIGNLHLPDVFYNFMVLAPLYFIDVPFEARLGHIVHEYGSFRKEDLLNPIVRIRKRLGGVNTRDAVNYLLEDNVPACFRILLTYYDKFYQYDLEKRKEEDVQIVRVECETVDPAENYKRLFKLYGNERN